MTPGSFDKLRTAPETVGGRPAVEPRRVMRRFEFVIEWGLFLCALLSIGTTIGIIISDRTRMATL